jgi:hypothetical protein
VESTGKSKQYIISPVKERLSDAAIGRVGELLACWQAAKQGRDAMTSHPLSFVFRTANR